MVAADGGDCVPTTVGGENEEACPTGQVMSASEGECVKDDDVLGGTIDFPGGEDDDVLGTGGEDTPGDATAGERAATSAAPNGAALPLTGAGVVALVIAGLALIGGGVTVLRRSR